MSTCAQLVGRVLFHRDELVELVRRYYRRDLSLALPDIASDRFAHRDL